MLNEKELEQAAARLQDFRFQAESFNRTHSQVLQNYSTLMEDYKRLKSDYEEERESREKYKQLARGQERNPFVLVLIDGDGYIFHDDLLSAGAEGGGRAAQLLNDAVRDSLRARGLDHCRIMIRVFANLAGLSKAVSKLKLAGAEKRSLSPFFANFNRSNELFDFVDAGELKENADFKIRAMFRLFIENTQCKHIFFAACHDVGYISELTPYVSGARDRITLVRSHAFHHEFARLGLRTEDFSNTFRSTPLDPANDMYLRPIPSLSTSTSPFTRHASASPDSGNSGNICTFFQKGMCKYGKTCKNLHVKSDLPVSSSLDAKDWRIGASPYKSNGGAFQMPPSLRADNDFMNSHTSETTNQTYADFKAALPREENIPSDRIAVNKFQQRLDPFIPGPSADTRAEFQARVTKQKLCNNQQLIGYCSNGKSCQYDHDPITDGIKSHLKQLAHNNPCPRRSYCRSTTCLHGHICQRADCRHRGGKAFCKFPASLHSVDLHIREYVEGTFGSTKNISVDENGSLNESSSSPPPTPLDAGSDIGNEEALIDEDDVASMD